MLGSTCLLREWLLAELAAAAGLDPSREATPSFAVYEACAEVYNAWNVGTGTLVRERS